MPEKNIPEKAPEIAAQEPAAAVSERTTNNVKTAETKTADGKGSERSKNSFFPGNHGLMIMSISHRDGKPVPAIHKLYASLAERFGLDDPVAAVMIELAVVDYWRLGQGQLAEKRLIDQGRYVFEPKGTMPTIIRYNAVARRNLEKSLQLLQENVAEAEALSVASEEEPEASSANGLSAQSDPTSNLAESDESHKSAAELSDAA